MPEPPKYGWHDTKRNPQEAAKFRVTDVGEALEMLRVRAPKVYAELSAGTRADHAPYVQGRFAYLAEGGSITDMNQLLRRATGRESLTQNAPDGEEATA